MKHLKYFKEQQERIIGYYINEDDYDDETPEGLSNMAYNLAKDRGIYISNSKDLLYVSYDTNIEKVVGALFRSYGTTYSFDIVVDSSYERAGIATNLVKIAISDYNEFKQHDRKLKMEIDCINPIMADILRRKFGFKDGGSSSTERITMIK